ncbi:cofilin [Histoplasma ohiense]|nr:cofilin [Histoplasma ohiense (nom. inval.)]
MRLPFQAAGFPTFLMAAYSLYAAGSLVGCGGKLPVCGNNSPPPAQPHQRRPFSAPRHAFLPPSSNKQQSLLGALLFLPSTPNNVRLSHLLLPLPHTILPFLHSVHAPGTKHTAPHRLPRFSLKYEQRTIVNPSPLVRSSTFSVQSCR